MGWVAAVLQVSALARNVPSTSAVPSNSGDTSVELRLVLPAAAQEGTGLQPTLGRVLQVFPSLHDVDVTLSSDPPVQVPESVVIPAGRSTATFPIRMENDDLVNPTNRVAFVRAAFGSQPPVKASLRVIDNDDPGITVRLPSYLVEGEAVTGSVQLGIPRDHPVTLTWKSDHPQLLLPPAAFLPPGTIEATFDLVLSNTSTLDGVGYASLCAQLGDFQAPCVTLQILDDEADVRDVEFAVPNAVFSDEPHPVEIRLKDLYGATSRTNLTGVAMLGLNPQVARFQPQPFPIAFSNGIFQGNLTSSGEAIVDWGGPVQTLAVGNDGVLAQAQMPVGFPHGFNPNLIRVGDLLYRGTGE